jgi:xylitol oxidase
MTNSKTSSERNWAGNILYSSSQISAPTSRSDLQALVTNSESLKALGTRHSFNSIADTSGIHISTRDLGQGVALDPARKTVTVDAGVRYGELAQILWKQGFALPNLASLPHISVAGACATATHGSGNAQGNLATSVESFEIVTGTGGMRMCSRELDGERFHGMVVHLGALGVVTKITLRVIPQFLIAQTVYKDLPHEELYRNFDQITGSAYSVSLFTDWRAPSINQVWLKEKVGAMDVLKPRQEFYGARPASVDVHPVAGVSAESCSTQCGIPGPWHERLPHFKLTHTPSVGAELQSEYFVQREHAVEAIQRIHGLREQISPLLMISEIRTVAADQLWLSPCYRGNSVGLHFTWRSEPKKIQELLPILEETLQDLDPIPHWGKISTLPAAVLESRYSKLNDFRKLVEEFDPEGRCANEFLREGVLPS